MPCNLRDCVCDSVHMHPHNCIYHSSFVNPGYQEAIRNETASPELQIRKMYPLCTGVLDYFPDALMAVANCSKIGNDQHNPGQPLHWAKEKSTDHADALMRHLLDRNGLDTDGVLHAAKVAWRALALLQTKIETDRKSAQMNDVETFVGPDLSNWQPARD